MAHHALFQFTAPEWVTAINDQGLTIDDPVERMAFVVDASRRNVEEGTGVPFAAAVFDMTNHSLVALGVNLVAIEKCSVLHGEMVALMLAERRLGAADFAAGRYELLTSSEPCAMCSGAIPWAGLKRVVCGARASDDRSVDFDEGDKRADWADTYRRREIEVVTDVCREAAVAVLDDYTTPGTRLYQARERAGLGM